MIVSGKVVKYGDNVNTDVIIPGRYLVLMDPKELAKHAMEGIDKDFARKARDGVVIVAGENFGCGSSREQASIALKHAGVKCVLAESFARIFFRNAINIGLPALECKGVCKSIHEGDEVLVDLKSGEVSNRSKGSVAQANPLPTFLINIVEDGGLIQHLRKRR